MQRPFLDNWVLWTLLQAWSGCSLNGVVTVDKVRRVWAPASGAVETLMATPGLWHFVSKMLSLSIPQPR